MFVFANTHSSMAEVELTTDMYIRGPPSFKTCSMWHCVLTSCWCSILLVNQAIFAAITAIQALKKQGKGGVNG